MLKQWQMVSHIASVGGFFILQYVAQIQRNQLASSERKPLLTGVVWCTTVIFKVPSDKFCCELVLYTEAELNQILRNSSIYEPHMYAKHRMRFIVLSGGPKA